MFLFSWHVQRTCIVILFCSNHFSLWVNFFKYIFIMLFICPWFYHQSSKKSLLSSLQIISHQSEIVCFVSNPVAAMNRMTNLRLWLVSHIVSCKVAPERQILHSASSKFWVLWNLLCCSTTANCWVSEVHSMRVLWVHSIPFWVWKSWYAVVVCFFLPSLLMVLSSGHPRLVLNPALCKSDADKTSFKDSDHQKKKKNQSENIEYM